MFFIKLIAGQLIWSSDDVLVGVAVSNEPRRLGLIYCTNRPSVVFQLSVSEEAGKLGR
jgi:hypothetical protein